MVIRLTDGYNANYYEEYLYIDPDNPSFQFVNLPTTLLNAYDNRYFEVKVVLKNSFGEGHSGQTIYWYQNYGDKLVNNEWDEAELGLTSVTDENGVAKKMFPARAGVKLIKATTREDRGDNEYLEVTSYIDYNIRNVYEGGHDDAEVYYDNENDVRMITSTFPVVDGRVIIPLNDYTPPGLYDVKVEYINNSQSQCKTYSNSQITERIVRKKEGNWELNTNSELWNDEKGRFEEEVTRQLEIEATLTDEYNKPMTDVGIVIWDGVKPKNRRTNDDGILTFHYVGESPLVTTSHTFSYPQNREYATTSTIVYSYTKSLKPFFSIKKGVAEYFYEPGTSTPYLMTTQTKDLLKDIDWINVKILSKEQFEDNMNLITYAGNDIDLNVRSYYYNKKYYSNDEEIKRNNDGAGIYCDFDDEGYDFYYIKYSTGNTTVEKSVWENAPSYKDFVVCSETPMLFSDEDTATLYPNYFKINDKSLWLIDRKSATDEGYIDYPNSMPVVTDGGLNLGRRYDCVFNKPLDLGGTKEYLVTLRLVDRYTRIGLRRIYNGNELQTYFYLSKWYNAHFPKRTTVTLRIYYDRKLNQIRISHDDESYKLIIGHGGIDYKIYFYSISGGLDSEVVSIEERLL